MDELGRNARTPWQMPWRGWKDIAVRSWKEASDDNIGLIAAGVAFYGFLAIVPLLTATVLTYGIFAEPQRVFEDIRTLATTLPKAVAIAIGEQLLALVRAPDEQKGFGVLAALAIALFGARNGAGAIITALNIAYEEEEKRSFIRLNVLALLLTAGAVVGAIIIATIAATVAALPALFPGASEALVILTTIASYGLLTVAGVCAAGILYRFGPSRRAAKWVWLTPGSLLSALLWLGLSLGFGAYVSNVGKFDATYGSLGAVVALLTWLYLASYVLLIGAEVNAELEHQTARDTTQGPEKAIGDRDAWVADHVAGASDVPAAPVEQERITRPASTPQPSHRVQQLASRPASRLPQWVSGAIFMTVAGAVTRWVVQGATSVLPAKDVPDGSRRA